MPRRPPAAVEPPSLPARTMLPWAMLVAAVLSCFMGYTATGFVDLRLPLAYEGDTLYVWVLVKTLASQLWVISNEALGAPGALEFGLLPMAFVGQLVALKALVFSGLAPITAINVYYLLSFGATAAAATWSLTKIGTALPWSVLGAVTYSLLPYHFLRAPQHLFLAAYYMVPLGAFVLIELDAQPAPTPRAQRSLLALCAGLTLFSDIYYTFFLGYLIGACGLLRMLAHKDWRRFVPSLQMLLAMLTSSIISLLPALYSLWRPGAEPSPLIRPANDSENYGLKLIQMLMPCAGHKTPWLARLPQIYNSTAPLVTENQTASLGLLGSACLLVVCVAVFASLFYESRPQHPKAAWLRLNQRLAIFTLLAFLFGTIGGLGAVMSYTTVTLIRSTNRISVFIAFFCIAGAMALAQEACRRWRMPPLIITSVAGILLGLNYFDVTDVDYFPKRYSAAKSFQSDQSFFEELERRLPQGAHVFQLPYVPFPEAGYQELDYIQAIPFLHTRELKFSFGTFRNTAADGRNRQTAAYFQNDDVKQTQVRLRLEGFDAVLLNRGFATGDLASRITRVLGEPIWTSPSQQFVLYKGPDRLPSL